MVFPIDPITTNPFLAKPASPSTPQKPTFMNIKTAIFTALALLAAHAQATEFIATNVYNIGKSAVVADEQWVITDAAATDGTFENDLNIMSASQLKLNGRFDGNITGAASTGASLNGVCNRNVRLFAGVIKIDGAIGGNLMAIGDTIIISTNAIIEGDALLLANSVIQEGEIEGDVRVTASRIMTLSGKIGGDTTITSQEIVLTDEAQLAGNLDYKTPKTIYPDDGVVGGIVNRIAPPALLSLARLYKIGIWFVAALLVGIPLMALFPMTIAMASQNIRRSPWKCLVVGMLASGALPLFGTMCLSSLISIPLGTLLIASWAAMAYFSRIILGLVIGTLILRGKGRSAGKVLASMALGLALLYASTIQPNIGIPIQMTVIWLGMGSLILATIQKRRLIMTVPQDLQTKLKSQPADQKKDSEPS